MSAALVVILSCVGVIIVSGTIFLILTTKWTKELDDMRAEALQEQLDHRTEEENGH